MTAEQEARARAWGIIGCLIGIAGHAMTPTLGSGIMAMGGGLLAGFNTGYVLRNMKRRR